MIIVTPLLAIIETQVEELILKISIKAVNLRYVSDEKLETHVRQNFLLGTRLKFGSKMKNGFRSSKRIRTRKKFISADEPHCVPKW